MPIALQFQAQVWRRAKDEGFEKRQWPPPAGSFLPFQQGPQFLGFEVSRQERVIDCLKSPVVFPSPGAGIAGQAFTIAFDLDEKEALGRENQQIDFVDAAVVGHKLEVCPRPVRFVGRKLLAHEVECFPFPGMLGLCDGGPVCHYVLAALHRCN